MANTGTRRTVKLGDFGAFEGDKVTAGDIAFRGTKAAERKITEGGAQPVYWLVESNCSKVSFSRNVDGDLIRKHEMRLVEITEVPETLRDQVVDAIIAARDEREGRQQLPLGEGDDGESDDG